MASDFLCQARALPAVKFMKPHFLVIARTRPEQRVDRHGIIDSKGVKHYTSASNVQIKPPA
jgi:hypothetical protein